LDLDRLTDWPSVAVWLGLGLGDQPKSQIWDSKIWSRVSRDSDARKTALARASSIYKRQTRPLVREGAPQKMQDRKCQTVIGARHQDLQTDWPSVAMWLGLGLGQAVEFWELPRTVKYGFGYSRSSNYNSVEETSTDVTSDHNCTCMCRSESPINIL
jgi:hypothetical protein